MAVTSSHRVGAVVGGRYQLRESLGGGGVGQVFRAWDTQGQRAVALKILDPGRAGDDALDRYAKLVATAGRAGHSGLVLPRGLGLASRNPPIVVMDSLTGDDVGKLRARLGRMPWMRALELCGQTAEILHAVYSSTRAAHRDLKPSNIFVTDRGEVRVLDYAIAELELVSNDSTRVDSALGSSVDYRAPEQLEGRPTDERTDVFALGVVLFELVSGQLPFHGQSYYEVARKIMAEPPPRLADVAPDAGVPVGVEGLIRRALGKQPEERFADLKAMADAIAHVRRFPGITPGAPVTAAGTMIEVRGQTPRPSGTVTEEDDEDDTTTTLMPSKRPGRTGANLLLQKSPVPQKPTTPPAERTVIAPSMSPRTGTTGPNNNLAALRPASATVVDPQAPGRTIVAPTTGAGRTVVAPTTGAGGDEAPVDRTVVFRTDSHPAVGSGGTVVLGQGKPPPSESTMILPDPSAPRAESTMILPDQGGAPARQDTTMILPDPNIPQGETTMALPDAASAVSSRARPAEATMALDGPTAAAVAKRPAEWSLQKTLIIVNVACGLLIMIGLLVMLLAN
ncbi:Protein kinase domain-containing protein [Nannocystis exedens]|uniref:Protein kinase domain-containing protein n=1 Tax=Nannocystis exedens TaxID=54 RepID=A0A1I2DKU6_9BACT|nr:serine/threonine-protein kinase [Nannocystis exedens]PCC69092.1 Serine/threonine-protein kinase PrkC [Nannocystis exedens]SFE80911.1 Protein kinase domain-containing protein [Nannocystis exedens]